jgi:hypothetical protein
MKKQILILIFSAGIAGLNSCSKNYFNINNNPNAATNASPQLVLSNALTVSAASQTTGYNFLQAWMGYLGQSGSYATGVGDIASYKETNTFGVGIWDDRYHNLEDYDYVEKSAAAENAYFYEAAAKIMKAHVFQQLVDMFNNVPYTEALQGTTNILPKYDSGQSIYHAIVSQIDTAVILMSRSDAIGSANSDVMFGGNNALWIQYANTLKLRILIRESQVSSEASFIQSEISNMTGGFLTQDAAVNPGYSNNSGQQNPVWGFYITLTGLPTSGGAFDFWKASEYSINWMQNNDDPRYKFIYAPGSDTVNGGYVGSVLGAVTNPAGTLAASPGPGILKSVSQPAIMLSAAESYFLQAEAVLRGWLPAGGDSLDFANGVAASFSYLGAGDPTAYLSQAGNKQTNYGACVTMADKLACIIRQKWIAMEQVTPFEAWGDYRRLHLPADIPLSISPFLDQSPAAIPIRILYPSDEYQKNAVNVNAQGNIDYHNSKVFWNQ